MKKFFPERFVTIAQIFFLTAGVALWQVFFRFVEEADTRFAMNLGRHVLEHGIPHIDPFTVHENLQLVAQQWLSGVFFWKAYENFGLNGLLATDYIFGALSVVIYWRLCIFISGNKNLSFAMALAVGLFISPMIVPRPHIISAPFFVAEIFLLEKFTRTGNEKFLLPLLPMSALLINFHAAMWAMMLVLCLPFMFVKNVRHVKFLAAAMAGIFFCGLINPYGLDAMTYVTRSYGLNLINDNIGEMFTPSSHDLRGKIFFATETLVIFLLSKNQPWRYIFLSGGLTYMAIMHWRNSMLFYLIATLPIAWALKNFSFEKFFAPDDTGRYPNRAAMLAMFFAVLSVNTIIITTILNDALEKLSAPLMILLTAATSLVLYNLFLVKAEGRILHPSILPRKIFSMSIAALIVCGIFNASLDENRLPPPRTYTDAIEFLLRTERPEDISLYAEQGIGGLAGEYGIRYYIDSRSEVFFKVNNGRKDIFAEYVDFTRGRINYRDFFARYNFTHIILTNDERFLFDAMSADKNFRVIYESERVKGSNVIRCKIFVPKEFHQ